MRDRASIDQKYARSGCDAGCLSAMVSKPAAIQKPTVDPPALPRDGVNEMEMEEVKAGPTRRRHRRLFVFLVLTVFAGWWLNGPGVRWLAPMVVGHFAGKSGVQVDFDVRGNFMGGLVFERVDVAIPDAGVSRMTLGELVPEYSIFRVMRGKIDGITARRVHLEVLRVKTAGRNKESTTPLDFVKLNTAMRAVRESVVDFGFEVTDLTVATDGAELPRVELGPTSIHHSRGDSRILLEVGEVRRDGEMLIDAQSIAIDWDADRFSLDRMTVLPGLSLTGFGVSHPWGGGLFADGVVDFGGAIFHVASVPEHGTLSVQLREGSLIAARVGDIFGVEVPFAGTLTSFALDAADLGVDPRMATVTMSLLVEDASIRGNMVDEVNVDVVVDANSARIVARAVAGDAEVRMDATTTLDRTAMSLGKTSGSMEIRSLPAVIHRIVKIPEEAGPITAATVTATYDVVWRDGFSPASAKLDFEVFPEDSGQASGFKAAVHWGDDERATVGIDLDGLQARVAIDMGAKRYSGDVMFEGFETSRVAAWLASAGVDIPGDAMVDASWRGTGPLATGEGHEGELRLAGGRWMQPDLPDIDVVANVSYSWPGRIVIREMQVVRDGQTIHAELAMEDGILAIDSLRWTGDAGDTLADARGTLPMPGDFADWREFLAEDSRSMDLTIRTRKLGFDKIGTWYPALKAVSPEATAELGVVLSGNFASPVLEASLEVLGVRGAGLAETPPADLMIEASGRDGVLVASGTVTVPDFAPAVMAAKLPFAPAAWARDVDHLLGSAIEATVDFPRLDLARFASLVPAARTLGGVVTGMVRVDGTVGNPKLVGGLELTGGSLELANDSVPEITGIRAIAEFDLDRAILRSLRATVAGGTFEGSGTFAIPSRELDFRARGNALPLVRNESLILRANVDLRVAGPFAGAAVSGSVSLVDSLFFRDIEILPIGVPFTGPQAAALPKIDAAPATDSIPEPFANWPLDVRVTTADPVLIRGNLATGSVLVDMRISGTLGDPLPDGMVRLSRGRAMLPFTTLVVPDAVLTFSNATRFDPVIEARGSAEPRPYTVNVFAYGRLSDPQIVLTSNPSLPQNEIMTLLATGTTTRGLENPQMASARALQLFAEEVRRGRVPMSNQLRPLLGLFDRVDFSLAESDPYSSDTYSTATLKLHDRWYLTAGMGQEGNTRMFAIWRLRFR